MNNTIDVVPVAIAFCIYFLPAIVAKMRGHKNTLAISALNLMTGWSGIGWIASLVWSLTR